MKHILVALITLFTTIAELTAQDVSLYQKDYFITDTDTLPYRILMPANYDASKKYPLIYFLHGSGERGNDNEKQLVHCAKLFLQADVRKNYEAIVVFPQCPSNSTWIPIASRMDSAGKRAFYFVADSITKPMIMAQGLLYQLLKKYPVKKKQVYIGGLSLGGMGTFEIVRRNPSIFAAAMPICGAGDTLVTKKMTSVKWWIFHGAKDEVVLPAYSQQMNDALVKAGANVKLTIYPEANHNSWDAAFAEPGLLTWLFAQHR